MIFDSDLSASSSASQTNLMRVESLSGVVMAKCQLRRQILRFMTKDHHAPLACRVLAGQRMRLLVGLKTVTSMSQSCSVSGRPRQVLRFGGLARMHLSQQFHESLVPSVVQKSW